MLDSSPAKNTFVHAALWNGTVASLVDLHPASGFAASIALATDGSRQGGWVSREDTTTEAALWSGTAASMRVLDAPGFSDTRVTGISSKYVVGDGWSGGPPNSPGANRHGLLWTPDGSSVIDLNQFLPDGYVDLTINGVDPDGNIAGYAQRSGPDGLPSFAFEIGVIVAPNPGASVASVTFDPSSVIIGQTATGTVTLKAPAIPGGVLVNFTSGNPDWVPAPAPVLVPEGQLSATFSVPTNGDAFFPGSVDLSGNVTPGSAGVAVVASTTYSSATVPFSSATGTLTITSQIPADPISSLTLTPTSLTDGAAAAGVVTLSAPAPAGGVKVAFSSSAPRLLGALPNLLIPAGQTSGSFTVATLLNAFNPFVNPTAKIAVDAATGSVMKAATLTGAQVSIAFLSVTPSTLAPGATGSTTATLAAPAPAGGVSVLLR